MTDELDPGLFRWASAGDRARRVDEFVELLRSAIGVAGPAPPARDPG